MIETKKVIGFKVQDHTGKTFCHLILAKPVPISRTVKNGQEIGRDTIDLTFPFENNKATYQVESPWEFE